MSRKRDFIQGQQSRDKHPDSGMKGSAADVMERGVKAMNRSTANADRQAPHSGKLANDRNKTGEQKPTQKNEGRRTPQSRHDRLVTAGSQNTVEQRTGGKGGGRTRRGAG